MVPGVSAEEGDPSPGVGAREPFLRAAAWKMRVSRVEKQDLWSRTKEEQGYTGHCS